MAGNLSEGMNTGAVRASAGTITAKAGEIEQQVAQAQNVVGQLKTHWMGPDSDHFQGEWSGKKRQLEQIADELKQFAKLATSQADAQDQTSA